MDVHKLIGAIVVKKDGSKYPIVSAIETSNDILIEVAYAKSKVGLFFSISKRIITLEDKTLYNEALLEISTIEEEKKKILDKEKEIKRQELILLEEKKKEEREIKRKELEEKEALDKELKKSRRIDHSKAKEATKVLDISSLQKDHYYSFDNVQDIFGCSLMAGGICVSNSTKTVVLVTDLTDNALNPYKDSGMNKDGTFIYTGQGQRGNQIINKTNQNGKVGYPELGYRLFYFIKPEKNKYIYQGEVVNNGKFYYVDEFDVDHKMRKVLKFPLRLK